MLRGGKDGIKLRRANHTIDIAKKAWTVVQSTHPHQFSRAVEPVRWSHPLSSASSAISMRPASEAFALSAAIRAYGHPHLAMVPFVCFEWLH